MPKYIAAIDQGTTSTRCIIFNHDGNIVTVDQKEHRQIYPKPGWVEHDALEIWSRTQEVINGTLEKLDKDQKSNVSEIAAVGVTNQRETTLVWDKNTGQPIYNAIVWQDTRTDVICAKLAKQGGQDRFRKKTGLPLATYFSGPKIKWILDNVKGARAKAQKGELLFGNIDTWIIWNLTGEHVTDVTNASRTLLMNLKTLDWDDEILKVIGIPRVMLPKIRSSSEVYGDVKTEKVSFQDLNISYEEKAFYDILKALAVKYNFVDTYPDEKYKPLAKEIKKIVDDNSKYVDWSNPDIVRKLCNLYFVAGNPFDTFISSILTDLFDLKTIRNASAHLSSTTRQQLDSLGTRKLKRPCANLNVSDFIFAVDPDSPTGETILTTYLNKLDISAEGIVNA